jgi:hypothetical protein
MVCAPRKETPAVARRGAKAEKTCIILQRLDLFHGFAQGGVAALRGPSSVDSQARDEKVPAG